MRVFLLTTAVAACVSAGFGGPASGEPRSLWLSAMAVGQDDWQNDVRKALDISDFDIIQLDLPPANVRKNGFLVEFETDEGAYSFLTTPHSVRSGHFQVIEARGLAGLRLVPSPPETTYRGEDSSGAVMAASIHRNRLTGWIRLSDDSVVGIQALDSIIPGSDPTEYVVFASDDLVPGDDWNCGVAGSHLHDELLQQGQGGSTLTCAHRIAEIAFDADVEFYQLNGSSIPNTVVDIEAVMNSLNVIYERDVGIQEVLRTIIVRTQEPDPYSSTSPNTLLNQFTNHWNANHANILRDHAHLMTGKNLSGGVIGIAFLGVVCNVQNAGYGLSQSRWTNNFPFRVALTAHEVGHNWNASHCDGQQSCRIMCSGLGGCTGIITSFGPFEIAQIVAFRNSRGCLFSPCALLTDISHTWGTLQAGGLTQLGSSDDQRLISRSNFGFQVQEANLIQIVIGAQTGSPSTEAMTIDLRFEGRLNQTGGTTQLQLKNWQTNSFQNVDTFPLGTQEIVREVLGLSAANRVRANDRRMELRIRQFMVATFSPLGFDSLIDHIQFLVEE